MDHQIGGERSHIGWHSSHTYQEKRTNSPLLETSIYRGHHGEGVFDDFKKTLGKAVTTVRNILPSSDANARPLFPGEHHALLQVNGKMGNANFMGPGTQIVKRVLRGDPPRTEADKVAEAHDLRYQLGVNERIADERMLSKLSDIKARKADTPFNIAAGTIPIQAKIAAENRGVIKRGIFTKPEPMSTTEEQTLNSKLQQLEQEGFGLGLAGGLKDPQTESETRILKRKRKKREPLPGEALLNKLTSRTPKRGMHQHGMGIGQRGNGIGAEPYAGPWLEEQWQNSIQRPPKRNRMKGLGIGFEPYAGPWLQGQWSNAMTGKGRSTIRDDYAGVANEPYGGSWLPEWQQAGGAYNLRSAGPAGHVGELPRIRRRRRPVVSTPPTVPLGPVSGPIHHLEPLDLDFDPHHEPILETDVDIVRERGPGALAARRRLGWLKGQHHSNPRVPDKFTYIGKKRYRSGNRPIADLTQFQAGHEFGRNTLNNVLIGADAEEWNQMNGQEKRQVLREMTGPIDEERADFSKRMQEAKKRKGEYFPWVRTLQHEISKFVIPLLMRMIEEFPNGVMINDSHGHPTGQMDHWQDPRHISNTFAELMNIYGNNMGRLGMNGWSSTDPKALSARLNPGNVGETVFRRDRADIEHSNTLPEQAVAAARLQEEIDDEAARREYESGGGLKLAGQGLKLAGQGLSLSGGSKALNRKFNGIYGKFMSDPSGSMDEMVHTGAHHISKEVLKHMKGMGYKFMPGTSDHLADYMKPAIAERLSHHMEGSFMQNGGSFWHSFVEGFKKFGLPILKAAATVAPLLL